MARKIHKSQLELFVEGYLDKFKHTAKIGAERVFIKKAAALINAVTANSPCCNDLPNTLFTPRDNSLTNNVRNLLFGIDRRLHKKSLERTIALLNAKLDHPCCCTDVTFTFTDLAVNAARIVIRDAVTQDVLFETNEEGPGVQTACILNEYFLTKKVQLCVFVHTLPVCGGRDICAYALMGDHTLTDYVDIVCDSSTGLNCQDNNSVPFALSETGYTLQQSCQGG